MGNGGGASSATWATDNTVLIDEHVRAAAWIGDLLVIVTLGSVEIQPLCPLAQQFGQLSSKEIRRAGPRAG